MMVDIVEKYGVVPKEIMPDTKHGASTGSMRRMVRRKIREAAIRLRQMHEQGENIEALRESKEEMLSDSYRLLAIHLGEPPKTLWLLENSWGDSAGHEGYLIMTDRWFDEYGFRLVVHKKFLRSKVLEIARQKSILLPPWDAMY